MQDLKKKKKKNAIPHIIYACNNIVPNSRELGF